jgi:hypothetical protein
LQRLLSKTPPFTEYLLHNLEPLVPPRPGLPDVPSDC